MATENPFAEVTPQHEQARQNANPAGRLVLLWNDRRGLTSKIYGINGIAMALCGPLFDDIESETVREMVLGLAELSADLRDSLGEVPPHIERKIRESLNADGELS